MATKTRIDMIRPFNIRSGILNTEKVSNALSQSQCAVGTRLCIIFILPKQEVENRNIFQLPVSAILLPVSAK